LLRSTSGWVRKVPPASTTPPPSTPMLGLHKRQTDPTSFVEDERTAEIGLRTIMTHLDDWLTVSEIAGMRFLKTELKDLGLIEDVVSDESLAALFAGNPQISRN